VAISIRLKRMGKAKQPFYRVVVADSRCARDGRFLEIIGTYDPKKNPAEILIREDKALAWLSQGAIPTDTVRGLLSKKGVMTKAAEAKQAKAVVKAVG
jgi:small subunit ribosomal protein S16